MILFFATKATAKPLFFHYLETLHNIISNRAHLLNPFDHTEIHADFNIFVRNHILDSSNGQVKFVTVHISPLFFEPIILGKFIIDLACI